MSTIRDALLVLADGTTFEGDLHVTYDDETYVAAPGDVVVVPAGRRARYAAPVFARMVYVYGPSEDGHAAHDVEYTDLD